jgi:hypothetical protein
MTEADIMKGAKIRLNNKVYTVSYYYWSIEGNFVAFENYKELPLKEVLQKGELVKKANDDFKPETLGFMTSETNDYESENNCEVKNITTIEDQPKKKRGRPKGSKNKVKKVTKIKAKKRGRPAKKGRAKK